MTRIDWDKQRQRDHAALAPKQASKRKKKVVHPNSMAALKWKRKEWLQ